MRYQIYFNGKLLAVRQNQITRAGKLFPSKTNLPWLERFPMKFKLMPNVKLIGFILLFPFLAIGVNIRGMYDDHRDKKLQKK